MNENQILRMAKLCQLLKKRSCINRKEIEDQLKISTITVYRDIEKLRDSGADIIYNKRLDTYCLINEFDILEYYSRLV